MENEEELVGQVLAAAGGELVGRVRIQKVFYLLDKLGMESGFSYSYHHYGPYSSDLTDAIDGAKAFRFVVEETRRRKSDGVPFGVFKLGDVEPEISDKVGILTNSQVKSYVELMNAHSSTVLEIAATIHWLQNEPGVEDWRAELIERKGQKTEGGRTDKALNLLAELGL